MLTLPARHLDPLMVITVLALLVTPLCLFCRVLSGTVFGRRDARWVTAAYAWVLAIGGLGLLVRSVAGQFMASVTVMLLALTSLFLVRVVGLLRQAR